MIPRACKLLIASILFCCCVSAEAAPEPATAKTAEIKIGAILPLSGSSAALGNYLKQGIELAYSQLPAEVQERTTIIFEDDGWEVPRSMSAFQKLTLSGIRAVIVVGSAVGNALAPLVEQKEMILMAIGASDPNVAAGRKFSFIHWVAPETEAKIMVDEIQRRGYRRICAVTAQQVGYLAAWNAVKDELKRRGLAGYLVFDETYLPSEQDFKTSLARIRALNSQACAVNLLPGALAAFARQARQQNLTMDLIGMELFEDEHEVAAAEGALLGQWYVNADSADELFVERYRSRFNQHPGWAAANAHDSLLLLVQALSKGEEGASAVEFLRDLRDYRGAAGIYSAIPGGRFSLPATIKKVTADGFVKVAR